MQRLKHKQKTAQKQTNKTAEYLDELLACVNAQCAAEVRSFCAFDAASSSLTIGRMWEAGRRLEELKKPAYRQPKEEGGAPVDVITVLSQALGSKSPSMLNKMWQLYRAFHTEAKRNYLVGLQLADGRPVTWSHWEKLLPLHAVDGDNSAFDKMLKTVLDESLTVDELAQRATTQHELNGGSPHPGGRPLSIPPSFRGKMAKLISQGDLLRKVTEACLLPQHRLPNAVKGMSQGRVAAQATEMESELSQLRVVLRAVGDLIRDRLLPDLDASQQYIQKCVLSHGDEAAAEAAGKTEAERIEEADAADE